MMKKTKTHNKGIKNWGKIGAALTLSAVLSAIIIFAVIAPRNEASAACLGPPPCLPCVGCCGATFLIHLETRNHVTNWHNWQREVVFGRSGQSTGYGTARLGLHEVFLVDEMFLDRLLPAMMMMTEQLVSNMMAQTFMIGAFLDAKINLETQLLHQKLTARAHKDYHPSFDMCVIGTNVRSLTAADFKADMTQMALSERFIDRHMRNEGSISAYGAEAEKTSHRNSPVRTPYQRVGYFLQNTCDRNDWGRDTGSAMRGLWICNIIPSGEHHSSGANRDIDFANTIMSPRIINVDFNQANDDAADNSRVLEMANYLYGTEPLPNIEATQLQDQVNISDFLDTRSVTAKRSVAQNSFNALVGIKSRGTHSTDDPSGRAYSSENTAEYTHFLLQQLGVPDTPAEFYHRYLAHKDERAEPSGSSDTARDEMSYYAQMEILSKKVFQRPEFYTELYDKPANVDRKGAALQAIGLMLERDIFDSHLRQEMMTSMLLELQIIKEQRYFENLYGRAGE